MKKKQYIMQPEGNADKSWMPPSSSSSLSQPTRRKRRLSFPPSQTNPIHGFEAATSCCPMVTHLRTMGTTVESQSNSSTEDTFQRSLTWDGILSNDDEHDLLQGPANDNHPNYGTSSTSPPNGALSSSSSSSSSSSTAAKLNVHNRHSVSLSVLYGGINATVVLPVVMSFARIIYRDTFFGPYTPVLVKLTMFSSMVHQLSFSALSSLPFAIGQVQDAGLIFLSSIATRIVRHCQQHSASDEAILATVTIGLGIGTALLGIGLILVGKLRLAQHVQKLPTCVVGGYLAFIGWFCGEAGLLLMTKHGGGGGVLTVPLLAQNIVFILPGLLGGLLVYALVRTVRHMAVLPCCIAALFLVFYLVLLVTGMSVPEATEDGWIHQTHAAPPVWYKTWQYLRFDLVLWSAYPPQILTLLSMVFVVALSSSLDIAAIDLELQSRQAPVATRAIRLDYNEELATVGKSNLISGLLGGYTGSYIFSQTIFSLRAGIQSRLAGFVLAAAQGLFLVVPFPILSYVPNFFFGTMLTLIAVDLMYSWLWEVRHKFSCGEYTICLATFGLIQTIGVEYGILGGLGVYVVSEQIVRKCRSRKDNTVREDDNSDDSTDFLPSATASRREQPMDPVKNQLEAEGV